MANVAVVKFRTIATSEVILADWKQGRLECLQNCLEDCRCNLQVATAFSQIAERCDRASFRLLIIPRLWPSNNSLSGFESSLNLVREITAPWVLKEVIVFDDDTKSLPLAEYCRVFAEGASEFLDSSSGSFAEELKRCVERHCLNFARRHYDQQSPAFGRCGRRLKPWGIVGESEVMVRVFEEVHRAAFLSDVPVLITGESGTGKQLLAEAIHRLDTEAQGPSVPDGELQHHQRCAG